MAVDVEYVNAIKRFHRANRASKCPYCSEPWPCKVYREVVQPHSGADDV